MNGATIAKAIVPLVKYIRQTRPNTPIILAEVRMPKLLRSNRGPRHTLLFWDILLGGKFSVLVHF